MGGCFFIGTREIFPDKSVKNWQNFFFTTGYGSRYNAEEKIPI